MAKGSSPPITAAILTVAVAVVAVAVVSYKSYQSKKPSRDDKDKDKNDNVVKKSDEPHTDDIPEERKDRSTSDATPLTSNVHKDEERVVSVDEVVVNSTSSNEKHINDTKLTTPKQKKKKKKKKIRPKLTPTQQTTPTEDNVNTAEDDLGFGDIATSSNSPKLLKKTIKLRPTPQKKQGSSISKGTNVKAPPNVEEGANYNSLSSYWKNQDKEHKFVAPIDSSASLPTSSLTKRTIINSSSASSLVDETKKKKVVSSSDGEIDTKQAVEEPKKKDDEGVKAVEEIIKVDKDEDDVLGEKVESIRTTEEEVPPMTTSSTSPTPALSKEVAVESTQLEASTPKEEEVTKETVVEDIVADNTAGEGNQEMSVSKTDEEVKPVEQEAVKEVKEKVSSIDTPNSTNEDDEQQLIIPSPTTSEDESSSSSSNQQLIIPSATTSENESSSDKDDVDEGGGGSSSNSSSQEFVKIYKSPSNNALTESEFLSRDDTTTTKEGLDIPGKEEDGKEEVDVTVKLDTAGSTDTQETEDNAQSTSTNKEDVSETEKGIEVAADDNNKEESMELSAKQDMKKNNNRKRNNNNKKKKKGKGKKRR